MLPLNFRERVRRAFATVRILSTEKETYACAQFLGGLSLVFYTKDNRKYVILCFVCAAVCAKGLSDYITIKKSSFPFHFVMNRKWSKGDFASGMFTYLTGVHTFSEFFPQHKLMCIPCIAFIASGYYSATSAINNLDRFLYERPFLKCCQLMFEPALTACATAYVFYFRNLLEGRLKSLPILVAAFFGFRLVKRGCVKFQKYLGVDRNLFLSIVGMTVGPLAISSGWLMVAFMEGSTKLHLAFMFLNTAGLAILISSLHRLHRNVSWQVFCTCCERVFGPILAVDSSIASAYIAYKIGRRYSLLTVPFVLAGLCIAYRGFRKEIRTSGC